MFDSGVPGFSPIVMVAEADLVAQQDRIDELLAANNSQLFRRRTAELRASALGMAIDAICETVDPITASKYRQIRNDFLNERA